ncbi:MAG: hypothetical protein ACI9YO_001600, partial [Gammaproteobacteria bacterium]
KIFITREHLLNRLFKSLLAGSYKPLLLACSHQRGAHYRRFSHLVNSNLEINNPFRN